ncbi:MAG: aminopeptidase P N-terminal domain-containing protein, partial [Clostridiales bacterium]|nr:aminopeptidase P N-terminal domain-containing protein [Clostridiales bacterium]
MLNSFHSDNRKALYACLEAGAVAVMFAGSPPRKTNDEYYPFFADRGFVYVTGIEQADSILLNRSKGETLYILPKDLIAERWNGRRLDASQAAD